MTTGELFLGPGGGRPRPEPLGRGEVGEASRAGSDLRETQVYPFISNIISDCRVLGTQGPGGGTSGAYWPPGNACQPSNS